MTYYLTQDDNADPAAFRAALAAHPTLSVILHNPHAPFKDGDEDAYEGPAELHETFDDFAHEHGFTVWV